MYSLFKHQSILLDISSVSLSFFSLSDVERLSLLFAGNSLSGASKHRTVGLGGLSLYPAQLWQWLLISGLFCLPEDERARQDEWENTHEELETAGSPWSI